MKVRLRKFLKTQTLLERKDVGLRLREIVDTVRDKMLCLYSKWPSIFQSSNFSQTTCSAMSDDGTHTPIPMNLFLLFCLQVLDDRVFPSRLGVFRLRLVYYLGNDPHLEFYIFFNVFEPFQSSSR